MPKKKQSKPKPDNPVWENCAICGAGIHEMQLYQILPVGNVHVLCTPDAGKNEITKNVWFMGVGPRQ